MFLCLLNLMCVRLNRPKPSLGSFGNVHFHQMRWAYGNSRDLKDGESGIAAQDGVDEQLPFRNWQGVGMV
jgi:hypothetical protein